MREKQWRAYRRFEEVYKNTFLKKLSERKSFDILRQLYEFVHNLSSKPSSNMSDRDRIKSLARIHAIFGKVKV